MSRADKFTFSEKQLELYSDFMLDFSMHPITGLLARVTNEESIKQSIKNLILTTFTERPYHPTLGSKIKTSLFEMMDSGSESIIKTTVTATLKLEPRIKLLGVEVIPDQAQHTYAITVIFSSVNIPNQIFSVNVNISLLR
jgi:phage baseplate assembly protein W